MAVIIARTMSSHLAVALAVLLLAPAARAQEDEYQAVIGEAVAEFDAGHFEEARALFRRAHQLSPSARTLRGLGFASFELRDYVAAHRALEASLASEQRPLTPAQRAEVEELLERTRRFVGVFRIEGPPPGATILVGGRPAELEPDGRLILAMGEHRLSSEETESTAVMVGGGEDATITLRVTDEPPAEEAQAPPPPVQASDVTVPAVVLSIGGALAVAAIVTGAAWWGYQDAQLARCAAPSFCDNRDQVATARDAAIGTTLSFAAVGASLAIAGAVLLASSPSTSSGAAFGCTPAPFGALCAGRF
jgi:tetratricopeptide (TPR) repeat protein